jgi:hypothetical protein
VVHHRAACGRQDGSGLSKGERGVDALPDPLRADGELDGLRLGHPLAPFGSPSTSRNPSPRGRWNWADSQRFDRAGFLALDDQLAGIGFRLL